jgi:hypothetical protein
LPFHSRILRSFVDSLLSYLLVGQSLHTPQKKINTRCTESGQHMKILPFECLNLCVVSCWRTAFQRPR